MRMVDYRQPWSVFLWDSYAGRWFDAILSPRLKSQKL
jgi:hypothetical protein